MKNVVHNIFLLLLGNPTGKQKSCTIYAKNKHKLCMYYVSTITYIP